MMDILQELEERAALYEQSGPTARYIATVLRRAAAEIAALRALLDQGK